MKIFKIFGTSYYEDLEDGDSKFLIIKNSIFGMACALLYRNDINIVRASFEGTNNFIEVHYYAIVYSGIVGVAGFCVTNFLYPFLKGSKNKNINFGIKLQIVALLLIVSAIFLLCLKNVMAIYFLIIILACLNPLLSAFAHFFEKSNYVYFIGASSFVLLLYIPWSRFEVNLIPYFLVYNCLIFALLSCVVVRSSHKIFAR
jgi:hypothetical protein